MDEPVVPEGAQPPEAAPPIPEPAPVAPVEAPVVTPEPPDPFAARKYLKQGFDILFDTLRIRGTFFVRTPTFTDIEGSVYSDGAPDAMTYDSMEHLINQYHLTPEQCERLNKRFLKLLTKPR